jgi:ribonuclease BN (tRNA processing enzyme)
VKQLVLTHLSEDLGRVWARDQAAEGFGGPVDVAREGAVYRL